MEISTSVAIIAGLLLVNTVFIVTGLIRAMKTMTEAQKFIEMARLQIAPISHDVTQILSDVRSIVRTAEKDMDKVTDGLSAMRDTAVNLKEFEQRIQERIERPLLDIATTLSALAKGGKVFWTYLLKK